MSVSSSVKFSFQVLKSFTAFSSDSLFVFIVRNAATPFSRKSPTLSEQVEHM
jgi:hypothetical protein